MIRLGSITGTGELICGKDSLGAASYSIQVWQDAGRGLRKADGEIEADDDAICRAFDDGKAKLRLEGGGEIEIVIENYNVMSGRADVAVSGAVPGF